MSSPSLATLDHSRGWLAAFSLAACHGRLPVLLAVFVEACVRSFSRVRSDPLENERCCLDSRSPPGFARVDDVSALLEQVVSSRPRESGPSTEREEKLRTYF